MRIRLDGIAEKSAVPLIPKLFIATPCYSGDYCDDYLDSMIKTLFLLKEKNIEFIYKRLCGDSILERSRNRLASDFLYSDCTHMLMIDSDQGWEPEKVYDMLMLDREFIAGAVPVKDPTQEDYRLALNCHLNGIAKSDEQGLLDASMIGSAFIMIKKEMLEKLIRYYRDDIYNPSVDIGYYSFFELTHKPVFMGEDVTFCKRWTDIGGKIWIMHDINMTHVGKNIFKGNYHQYLTKQPKPQDVIQLSNGLRIK